MMSIESEDAIDDILKQYAPKYSTDAESEKQASSRPI